MISPGSLVESDKMPHDRLAMNMRDERSPRNHRSLSFPYHEFREGHTPKGGERTNQLGVDDLTLGLQVPGEVSEQGFVGIRTKFQFADGRSFRPGCA